MKTLLLPLLIGLAITPLSGLAQATESATAVEETKALNALDERKISAELRFPKASIMVGEPLAFEFVVRNASDLPLSLEEGGDYRNAVGRPDSFRVKVTDEEGKAVFQPPSGPNGGGLISFKPLPAKDEKVFRLFLPHWAVFDHAGKMALEVAREITVDIESAGGDILERRARGRKLRVCAEAELTVVPASPEAFGKLINELGTKALDQQPNRSNPAAEEAVRHLRAIHDVRVVPWFLKLLKIDDWSSQFNAINALASYDTPEAFEGLKEAVFQDRKTPTHGNLTISLAYALTESPYKEAWPFLQTQADHPHPEMRRSIIRAIRNREVQDNIALPLLENLAKDQDELVRREASELLKLRES